MRTLLRDRQVRSLLLATLVSTAGDQLARVALTVLVFARTGSTLLAGFTYAATFLPALIGAPLLGGLADRRSRKQVLVAADLVRAALVAAIAVPGVRVSVALLLVVLVTLVECPFDAARAALLPTVAGPRYAEALALDRAVQQGAQVLGFAVGGLVLVVVAPTTALLVDAATFLVSAGVLAWRLAPQPPALRAEPIRRGRVRADVEAGVVAVLRDASTRRPVLFVWLSCAVACVPEGLAAPYAHALHGGPAAVALLMAANPVGNVVSGLALARTPERRAVRLLTPLALLAAGPLVACLLAPSLLAVVGVVALSGAGMALSVLARAQFVRRVPDEVRGRAFAFAATGITVVQGIAIGVAAAVAEVVSPGTVVGIAGALGVVGVLVVHVTHPVTPHAVRSAVPVISQLRCPPREPSVRGADGDVVERPAHPLGDVVAAHPLVRQAH